MTIIQTLIDSAKKKHDQNGNPVYRISIDPILESGMSFSELKKRAKDQGIRLVEKQTKISVPSYNLNSDLTKLLADSV